MTNAAMDVKAMVEQVRAELIARGTAPTAAGVGQLVASTWPLLADDVAQQLVTDVLAEVCGLGALQPLLADDAVTDILVNGPGPVWVERAGRLEPTSVVLFTGEEITRLVERVIAPLGLRLDRSSPCIDARLPDGSRLHAVLPPVAVDGPCVAIRRFSTEHVSLHEFVAARADIDALISAVRARRTIVIAGGTGAGKTTLLNALIEHIGPAERVITIEDAAELQLPHRHVVRLEARPANADGVGEISIRQLVRNALRLRPDRIIVGEVRGAEAFDMLQAINTGHTGSLTTCHANSAPDALARLETMALLAGVGIPIEVIRRQLIAAIGLVAFVAREDNGRRRIVELLDVGEAMR
jgi:pilus assembly protein CpaF